MLFMIGYPTVRNENFNRILLSYREQIKDIYFSFPGIASGRGTGASAGIPEEERLDALLEDLNCFHHAGIGLNLLLNGNCYGKNSLGREFYNRIGDTVDFLVQEYGLSSVTTASPVIAGFLKKNFQELELRASVNMEIGSVSGMEYLQELFDGYYLKRELNRDIAAIRSIRQWCNDNGKKLYALVNSGCLNNCSAHNFHDNLVAHEDEIREMDNAFVFQSICGQFLKTPEHRERFLEVTNFIRPEDLALYEGLFDGIKLATRTNRTPAAVALAYFNRSFRGNLPELLEPDHAGHFYPEILANDKIPAQWVQKVLHCSKDCANCTFCRDVFNQSRITLK
ncbi:MAG: hypothetical protein IJZ19_09655 [Lentisphaeria bacterium]|nr:hypothetical protein [Lentisphaeria bacterium]